MAPGDVFPAEMPDHPTHPIPPLDADTAERLLTGRLDPDDAPPAYAEVARLLRAATGPAIPDELAGHTAALAAFRTTHPGPTQVGRGPAQVGPGPARTRGRPARGRARLVAVALAGTLAAGGLWIADGARTPGELASPTGGPGAGGSGSGAPGSGEVGGLPPAWLLTAPTTGRTMDPATASVTGGRTPVLPSSRDRATARHGAGVASRGGGSPRGARPAEPSDLKAPKAKPSKSKAPKAKPGKGGNRTGGNRK